MAADGASIIGVDICADIASNGYPMASRDELDETVALVEAKGGKMIARSPTRDFPRVEGAVDRGVEQFGRLDIVLANAGIATMAFRELTIEEELEQWTDVVDVNLVGARSTPPGGDPAPDRRSARAGRSCSPARLRGWKGFGGLQGAAAWATRHPSTASWALMRTLANALAPQNIRVNTVHPTAVRTMMAVNPAMVSFLENYPDGGPHLQNPLPVDMLEPEDVSAAIAYLVGDDAKYVTG